MTETLTFQDIVFRLGATFVAGFLLGLERESRGRPAGLRTTLLACMAAAIAMIVSEALFASSAAGSATWRPDPARLGAGILTGIGFLGAGTILRHEHFVRGVTTAATLWFVTVLGLAFGSGQFLLGSIGGLIAFVTLFLLPSVERFLPADWYSTLTVVTAQDGPAEEDITERLATHGVTILEVKTVWNVERRQRTNQCDIRLSRRRKMEIRRRLVREIAGLPGVVEVRWS